VERRLLPSVLPFRTASSRAVSSVPFLFSVYFDEVLCRLQSAGVGCYIGQFFMGALAYADDLTLLAPTASAMRRMLAICERFVDEFHVTFNVERTKCVIFASRNSYCRAGAPNRVQDR
jgi:hypothetical protein